MWQVTYERWHMTHETCDMWHMTPDTWHMTQRVVLPFSQNFSSLSLPVRDWQCLEDILTKGSVSELIN